MAARPPVGRARGAAFPEIRARSTQHSDADAFDLAVELEVDVDGGPFFRRSWEERIPRRLV